MEESGNAEKPEKQFRNFPPLSPSLTALQGTHFLKQKREEINNEEKVENNILVLMWIIEMPDLDVNDH